MSNGVEGMTTVSGGGVIRDINAPSARCLSCGAFGEVVLCAKHAEDLIKALDYHTKGLLAKLIDEHKKVVAIREAEEEAKNKLAQLETLKQQIVDLQNQADSLKANV